MNKTRIAVSIGATLEKHQARHEKNMRDVEDRKRIDEIVVQQHIIRRFKSRHRSDYDVLINMRRELDRFLINRGLEISSYQSVDMSRPNMLACIMDFFQNQENINTLQHCSRTAIRECLHEHISYFSIRKFRYPLIDSPDIPDLAEILIRYSGRLADMHRRLNYFAYYTPYGLTSEVFGEKLYTHYARAKTGRASSFLRSALTRSAWDQSSHEARNVTENENIHHKNARWLYTDETAQDMDLSALIETACYVPSHQADIETFVSPKNRIVIDGVEKANHLVLAIPVTRFPTQIDAVMEKFREDLLYELKTNTIYDGDNAERADLFYQSAFVNTLAHRPCLVRSFKGIQTILLGLWAWDLVQLGEETPSNASEAVLDRVKKLMTELGDPSGMFIPGDSDSIMKNGYDKVVKIAGSATGSRKKQRSSLIDKYLTGSRNIVIGEVD